MNLSRASYLRLKFPGPVKKLTSGGRGPISFCAWCALQILWLASTRSPTSGLCYPSCVPSEDKAREEGPKHGVSDVQGSKDHDTFVMFSMSCSVVCHGTRFTHGCLHPSEVSVKERALSVEFCLHLNLLIFLLVLSKIHIDYIKIIQWIILNLSHATTHMSRLSLPQNESLMEICGGCLPKCECSWDKVAC
jgi:hypothetical protein